YYTTSKLCFEQPATSFLVCPLIFIEYKIADKTITIIGLSRVNVGRRIAPPNRLFYSKMK
ncbi:TPA: hypothetical protein ACKDCC_001795, partial [Streptococcus pneumoniae]